VCTLEWQVLGWPPSLVYLFYLYTVNGELTRSILRSTIVILSLGVLLSCCTDGQMFELEYTAARRLSEYVITRHYPLI
jgi:hypothetical protein